jgi:uncharacterized protein (TIGR02145 family)
MKKRTRILNVLVVVAIVLQPMVCFGEPININKLEKRDDVYFYKNKPYTGEVIEIDFYRGHTGNMKNGKRHGKWEGSGEGGSYTGNYKDGKKHGEWKEFEAGASSTGNYKDDKKHGEWKNSTIYDDGEYSYVENYIDGKRQGEVKMFDENGNLKSITNYKDDKREGEQKEFYENGNLKFVENYKDNKHHGEVKEFYENENLKFVKNYKDGKREGEQKEFYENGNLKFVENYKDNKPHGEWKYFNENGKLIKAENIGDITKGIFTDKRDGKKYKTVKIGIRTWMAENLNYDENGSVCYDNKPENCNKYGKLYDWYAAKKTCPSGWYLPNTEEWQALVDFVGGKETAGKKLKAKSGWNADKGKSGNGTDDYGFSALPGGFGFSDGRFVHVGGIGDWWSASEDYSHNAFFVLDPYRGGEDAILGSNYDEYDLFSVRCIQNLESDNSTADTAQAAAPAEPDKTTPASPPIAGAGSNACNTEVKKAKAISDKCKKIGKGKSGYDECEKEYKAQKAKVDQSCRIR